MSDISIHELRKLGLVETKPNGEFARLGVHLREARARIPAADFAAAIKTWASDVSDLVKESGGEIVPQTFSLTGQSLEVLLPLDKVSDLHTTLQAMDSDLFVNQERLPSDR